MAEITLRAATEAEADAIAALLDAAFGGPDESRLVDGLRKDGDLAVCLVAVTGGEIVGAVAFSPLTLAHSPDASLFALAPLAVAATHRRQGVGARLAQAGLEALWEMGATGVVVLGDPAYYGRFGFRAEDAADLTCAWSGPHLQALTREGGRPSGALRYARAFDGM